MSKKSRFRGCFDKQYGKLTKAQLKSGSHHLDHNHLSLGRKLRSKKSLLLTCRILVLLVNTLAADEMYPSLNRNNLTKSIQMQLSHKQKQISEFFTAFLKLDQILNILNKKLSLTAFLFPQLKTPKTWLDKCLKSPVAEDPSRSNMVNVLGHC